MALVFQVQQQNLPRQTATRPKLFSHGCLMCLRRRVKCDEGKPTCKRCEKINTQCPGYRNSSNLIFRDMNRATEKQVQRRKGKEKTRNAQLNMVARIKPERALTNSLQNQGICFVIDNYVFAGTNQRQGYLDFLPMLMSGGRTPGYFNDIIAATGIAAMSLYQNRPELLKGAVELSSSAFRGMADALRDPKTRTSNELLAASFMAGKYQNISGDNHELFEVHGKGQLTLLKERGPKQLDNAAGRSLFFHISSRATTRGIVELEIPDFPVEELVEVVPTPNNPMTKMQQLLSTGMLWMVQAKKLVLEKEATPQAVCRIAENLLRLDQDLEDWYEELPTIIKPIAVDNDASLYVKGTDTSVYIPFLDKIMIFESTLHTGMWIRFATGRIQILRMLDVCLTYCKARNIQVNYPENRFGISPDDARVELVDVIRDRLQNFVYQNFRIVPFMLGKLKTLVLDSHPLNTIAKGGAQAGSRPKERRDLSDCSTAPVTDHSNDQQSVKQTTMGKPSATPEAMSRQGQPFGKALGGFWLMWTLYPSGLVTCLPDEYYFWIEERLFEIGHAWGVKQALLLRQNLQSLRGVVAGFTCFPA